MSIIHYSSFVSLIVSSLESLDPASLIPHSYLELDNIHSYWNWLLLLELISFC